MVPETTHHKLLETIRDEIEKGNVKIAETKLSELPAAVTEDNRTRHYVSVLWNNLGIQQEKHGGTAVSINAFKKAASLDAMNPVVQLNLAHAYWELRDPAMTQDFLEKLVLLPPNEPFPHLALANLFQERDQLGEAARHLDQATARADKDPAVQSYLRTVTAKRRGTEKSEARLTSRDSAHFTVKFDGEADQATSAVVLEILEEAYREIGQKLGTFRRRPSPSSCTPSPRSKAQPAARCRPMDSSIPCLGASRFLRSTLNSQCLAHTRAATRVCTRPPARPTRPRRQRYPDLAQ